MNKNEIIKPKKISKHSTVGIFTPSWPAHVLFKEKYLHAISELRRIGFKVVEGNLTSRFVRQGYRSGTPEERASEFMSLVENDSVDFLMSTIGGSNSSSMLHMLDYNVIKRERKLITGYSDDTSLHMAILTQARLSTFYGPALVPTFGEWPNILGESLNSFLAMATESRTSEYVQPLFLKWSNYFRNAFTNEWKDAEREYKTNPGYTVLSEGTVEAPIIIANLNTLGGLAGTKYFPQLNNEILLIETMNADFDLEERTLNQLKNMGVFDNISGLIIGKPEVLNDKGAPFSYDDLIMETVGKRAYPIISNYDCGHTHPMHTMPQMINIRLEASGGQAYIVICESAVD